MSRDFTDRVERFEHHPDCRAYHGIDQQPRWACVRGCRLVVEADEAAADRALARVMQDAPKKFDPPVTDEALRAQRDRLHAALARLLRAYPRLASEFSGTEQQRALRWAICALEECK